MSTTPPPLLAEFLDNDSATLPILEHGTASRALLATRRQLREMNLRPGGHPPVAQMRCRRCATRPTRTCTNPAWLYRVDLAKPKRTATLAQEAALDRAMAARQTCPLCGRRYTYVIKRAVLHRMQHADLAARAWYLVDEDRTRGYGGSVWPLTCKK